MFQGFGYVILLAILTASLGTLAWYLLQSSAWGRKGQWELSELNRQLVANEAASCLALYSEEVSRFRKRRNVLDMHVNEYFHTFQDAGWPALKQLLANLGQVETQLHKMMEAEAYEDVIGISNLLLDRVSEAEKTRSCDCYPTFAEFCGWQQKGESLLLQIVNCLEGAAGETRDMGISRQRKRQPTLVAISEVRQLLSKEQDRS